MKKILLTGVFAISLVAMASGQVSINNDNSDPDPSAGLEVKFENKGFLPPRVTTAQMNSIPNPTEGLLVYNTSLHSLAFFNGTSWKSMDGQHFIGERFGGGIIFYLESNGQHGMIAADTEQPMGEWGCYQIPIGGTSTLFGTGQANTTLIVNSCPFLNTAARICDDLVLNGYSDWFLPSRDELVVMYEQHEVIGIFANDFYWTSSECDANTALSHSFEYNYNYCRGKYDISHFRAVRVF